MRTLSQILEEMQRLPTKPDESAHMIADALLIEAIQLIASLGSLASQRVILDALVSAYNQIEKWYA